MSKNTRWSADDLKKKGLVQNEAGDYVPVSSLVNKGKVKKFSAGMNPDTEPSKMITKVQAINAYFDDQDRQLNNKIDSGSGAYDGSKKRFFELDEFGQWEMPNKAVNLNPFTLPDWEVIDVKFEFQLDPFPAPRMSRSDQWRTDPYHPDPKKRQRQCVFRYFAWRAAFTAMASQKGYVQGERLHVVFIFPLPVSYSRKKRETLMGQLHKQRPDYDNCAKSIGDAFRVDDGYICDVRVIKLWGPVGRILIF